MTYKKTTISVSIHHQTDSPLYGESVTIVSLNDEGAGPFIVLSQHGDHIKPGELRFDMEELSIIHDTARELIKGAKNE